MSIYEYDEEKVMQMMREEAREEGLEEGREKGREEGRKDSDMRVFKTMISCQYSREEAQKISGLTDEQVEVVLEEMN